MMYLILTTSKSLHTYPAKPEQKTGRFLLPGLPGPRNAMTEDCCVDDRGYIYVTCFDDGFYVLKKTGAADN